jgi:hypothetical protein
MSKFPENLGKPDIKIAGLEIWIHGNQYPASIDYWDGNWLDITAKCTSEGAVVWVSGNIIHLPDIEHLKSSCEHLYKNLKGKAELPCIEPNLSVEFRADTLGQISMIVNITPDHLNQDHKFNFEIDQSYLPNLISSCKRILSKYPIKGNP